MRSVLCVSYVALLAVSLLSLRFTVSHWNRIVLAMVAIESVTFAALFAYFIASVAPASGALWYPTWLSRLAHIPNIATSVILVYFAVSTERAHNRARVRAALEG